MWCIERNLKLREGSYNSLKYFKERLNEEDFFKNREAYSRYKLFSEINQCIGYIKKLYLNGPTANAWITWWKNYLQTYLHFRDSSLVVKIIDNSLNIELSYSLAWILQYKEILKIEEEKKNNLIIRKYTVGDLKDRDKNIQYQTDTIPGKDIGATENQFLTQSDMFTLSKTFEDRINNIKKRKKVGIEKIDKLQLNLLEKVILLGKTFDRKRLNIINIVGNDNYL
jgi:hypothetical protein